MQERRERAAAMAPVELLPFVRGVVVVAGVLILTLGLSIFVPDPRGFGGPLQASGLASSVSMAVVRRAGERATSLGLLVPWNTSGRTAVLSSITPIGAEGLEITKAGVLPPGQTAFGTADGFPPLGLSVVPLEGYSVAPGSGPLDGIQLAVGLRRTSEADGSVLGFLLEYRVGGTAHRSYVPTGAMLCDGRCEGREDAIAEQRAVARSIAAFVDAPSR